MFIKFITPFITILLDIPLKYKYSIQMPDLREQKFLKKIKKFLITNFEKILKKIKND